MRQESNMKKTIIRQIQFLMERRHWTAYHLAREAGVSVSTISNIFQRGSCPSISLLQKITDAFGMTLSEFMASLETGDYPLPEDLTEEEYDIVSQYRTLSKSNRKLLAAYINGLSRKAT